MKINTKYIVIDNLSYEAMSQIFDTSILYNTNHIVVKCKKFTLEEIDVALECHSKMLLNIISPNSDDDLEYILDNRGKIIDILIEMSCDPESSIDCIRFELEMEQAKMDYFGKNFFDRNGMPIGLSSPNYFNPIAKIDVEYI